MTTHPGTPARTAKHVRIDEDNNDIQVIQVKLTGVAPSTAACNHVKAAVAFCPEAIQ